VIKIEINRLIDILICFFILTPFVRSCFVFFCAFKSAHESVVCLCVGH
jgi:hypothetical protein